MPIREQIMMQGEISMGFNLSKPVGDKQFNLRDDVFMVQALLRFIVEAFHGGRMTGMTSAGEVPDFNGRMDGVTLAAIRTFQRRWAHNLIRSDGVIHPAQYRFRNITASPRGPLMTITMLHLLAQDAARQFNETDYTELVLQRFFVLRSVTDGL
jgi:hypothetical protein